MATGILLLLGPGIWTVGMLAPEAFVRTDSTGSWASFDVARARSAYRQSLVSEPGLGLGEPAGPAEAAFQVDAIRPEVIATVSEMAAADGMRPRDVVAVLTVEQAARVVLAANRPVAILYDEYRSRPLLSVDQVDRLARGGDVKLFAVSPAALATDPDLEGWIANHTVRVVTPAEAGALEIRAYQSGG